VDIELEIDAIFRVDQPGRERVQRLNVNFLCPYVFRRRAMANVPLLHVQDGTGLEIARDIERRTLATHPEGEPVAFPSAVALCSLDEILERLTEWLERDNPSAVAGLSDPRPVLPGVGANIDHDIGALPGEQPGASGLRRQQWEFAGAKPSLRRLHARRIQQPCR
jgi:hypothetical protein